MPTNTRKSNPSIMASRAAAFGMALALLPAIAAQAAEPAAAPDPKAGMAVMQKQMAVMTPELQEKAKALSPEIKGFLGKVAVKHTRHSERATMVQVMHELLADYQAMAAGIAVDNAEMTAEAARRLAHHRLPRGGLLPYMSLEKVNSKDLAVLPGMEATVEGGAMEVAEAAEKGDMATAAEKMGKVMGGCVACHQMFRGTPGVSPRVRQ